MVKGQCLQEENLEGPVLQLILLQVCIIHQPEGDGGRCLSETHGLTLGPIHPVSPDLEGGPGLTQDPEAFLGLEVDLILDLDLTLIRNPGQDPGQGPGTDRDHHPEKGVYLDLQRQEKQASPNQTS